MTQLHPIDPNRTRDPLRRGAAATGSRKRAAGRAGQPRRVHLGGLVRVSALVTLLATGPALAHKLNLFAAAEGRLILGEVYFAGGGKAADVPVRVQTATGELLAELRSGADGTFGYTAEAPVEHALVAETPDGHRAEWRIRAVELAGAFPAGAGTAPSDGSAAPAWAAAPDDAASAAQPANAPGADTAIDPALAAAIERAVARQVRPLRAEAIAARDAVHFRDVLGGVGYIAGLAGLGLWWRCRRARSSA
jgi:nickel transport protein